MSFKIVDALSWNNWWQSKWYSHTFNANCWKSLGTFKRLHSVLTGSIPRCSCMICRGKTSAGVRAFPKSWHSTAKRTMVEKLFLHACCNDISVWIPQSISGWYSARCGTPKRASTSGNQTFKAQLSRSTEKYTSASFSASALTVSFHTRSAERWESSPDALIFCMSCMVSGAIWKP